MTVLIYVDTSKQVGDPDHLKADTAPTDDTGRYQNHPRHYRRY
jgi:hypothetical protein